MNFAYLFFISTHVKHIYTIIHNKRLEDPVISFYYV